MENIFTPELQYRFFCDERITPIITAKKSLPSYLSIQFGKLYMMNIIESLTNLFFIVVIGVGIFYFSLEWWYGIYAFLIMLLAMGASGSNANMGQIIVYLFLWYFFIKETTFLNQLYYYYNIFVWVIVYIQYYVKLELSYRILEKEINIFESCAVLGLISISINEEDFTKYYIN